jgi:hypothetical protein
MFTDSQQVSLSDEDKFWEIMSYYQKMSLNIAKKSQ